MVKLYPSKNKLNEIAEAALAFAKALRDNWFLYDAPIGNNPGYSFLPTDIDIEKPEHTNLLFRQCLNVGVALKALRDLLDTVTPGNFLKGLRDAGPLLDAYPHETSEKTVVGWPFEVSRAIAALQWNLASIFSAEQGFQPIPFATVKTIEDAGLVLRTLTNTGKGEKPRISKSEANKRAQCALKGRPPKGKRWSQRTLAKVIGCASGQVPNLTAWQAYADQHGLKSNKGPTVPKGVSLTDAVLATEGREDETLQQLIAEHCADFEESPLVPTTRKQRIRRPKV